MSITGALFLSLCANDACSHLEYPTLLRSGDAAIDVVAVLNGNRGEDLAGTDRNRLSQFDCRGWCLKGRDLLSLGGRCSLDGAGGS